MLSKFRKSIENHTTKWNLIRVFIMLTTQAEQVPGIKIFRSQSCLCFVNAEYFKNSLYSKVFKKKQRRGTSDTINGNGLNGTQPVSFKSLMLCLNL